MCDTIVLSLFYHLEHLGLLESLNETRLYALHFVCLPRINSAFQKGWNHHSIRTEGNRSPHQLFVQGSLTLQRSGLVALDFGEQVDDNYGVEENGLVHDEQVTVPESLFEVHERHYMNIFASKLIHYLQVKTMQLNFMRKLCHFLVMCHNDSYMTTCISTNGLLREFYIPLTIIGKKRENMTNSEFEIQYYKYSSPNLGSS
jgi:hypothetical protein